MNRPNLIDYKEPEEFVKEMIAFLKMKDKKFSILAKSKGFRRLSPTLVTLIIKKKRKLTFDRTDEMAQLLSLSVGEKELLKKWIINKKSPSKITPPSESLLRGPRSKEVSTHLLNDWLNVYVKDCFQIEAVQKKPQLVYEFLSHLASPKRVHRSLRFLLKEGYLRKRLDGTFVVESALMTAEPPTPQKSVRRFHKAALEQAKRGLEDFSTDERFANTFVMPLDEEGYEKLRAMINEFSLNLKDFLSTYSPESDGKNRLYQLTMNLCPTGGAL